MPRRAFGPPRTFGIVGYGHFGAFMARSLARHDRDVVVTDVDETRLPHREEGVRAAAIEEAAAADVVVAAVPFSALRDVLEELHDRVAPTTVVMDVVSTKSHATELLRTVLRDHPNVMATHPLFGPPSMKAMGKGQRLVVTYQKGRGAEELRRFLETEFGLHVLDVDPEEHDRAMAYMQALPFFIARALVELDIPIKSELALPSYEKLARIAAIEEHHTPEMFETSQRSNPFAAEMRTRFLELLQKLDAGIPADDYHGP